MKPGILEANFPRDGEGKVYHMGIKKGEVANRVLTVGDHIRARKVAQLLDSEEQSGHALFENSSQRGFLTITGRYKGIPVSIIAIGMGSSMIDFFIRETRAITEGPLVIIRFGSCGSLSAVAPAGAVIVPRAGYCIRRNIDYFAEKKMYPQLADTPYLFSGIFPADIEMTNMLSDHIQQVLSPINEKGVGPLLTGGLNTDGCSFYSSQGRKDVGFWDDNENLLEEAITHYPDTYSVEMETSMLFHLAKCCRTSIRTAGCMQVFADRVNNSFITSQSVDILEPLIGKACLDTLVETKIENEQSPIGTVWESQV